MKRKVRLTQEEIRVIKDTIKKYDENAKIVLFGSRVDLNKKGGDIDLLVISKKLKLMDKLKILREIKNFLGERKIDLIITDNVKKSAFYELAYEEGVEL